IVEQRPIQIALRGDATVAVEVLAAAGVLARERIDHHVAGARIERDARGNDRNVGDATDIEGGAGAARMPEQQAVDEGNERRALATGGDIARAEIGDYRHSGALRDYRRLADLQCAGAAFVIDRSEEHTSELQSLRHLVCRLL